MEVRNLPVGREILCYWQIPIHGNPTLSSFLFPFFLAILTTALKSSLALFLVDSRLRPRRRFLAIGSN